MLSASTHGDMIRLLVDRAGRESAIQAICAENGVAVHNLREVKPRLEDVFVLAVKGQ